MITAVAAAAACDHPHDVSTNRRVGAVYELTQMNCSFGNTFYISRGTNTFEITPAVNYSSSRSRSSVFDPSRAVHADDLVAALTHSLTLHTLHCCFNYVLFQVNSNKLSS